MRRAYSMPLDEEVASVGPIDPQVGLLRLDRADGTPLAVLYQFACHPIMNPPSKGCSADYPGYASKVIEEALGGGGAGDGVVFLAAGVFAGRGVGVDGRGAEAQAKCAQVVARRAGPQDHALVDRRVVERRR